MMRNILCFIGLILSYNPLAQEAAWQMFIEPNTQLKGFKDSNGEIKIPPKFMGFTIAERFSNIIAVMEEKNDKYESYYLLRDGRQLKRGDLYINDMAFDCESEKKIRFRDKTIDRVGFLDNKGQVIIPALYSDASAFKNGLASVIENAKRLCHDDSEFSPSNRCEHWRWSGGKQFIIDSKNKKLLKGVYLKQELDPYSLKITTNPNKSVDIESFAGLDGNYYQFTNFKKSFATWFKNSLLTGLNKDKLHANSNPILTLWDKQSTWYQTDIEGLSKPQLENLFNEFNELAKIESRHFVILNGLNPFIYSGSEFDQYFNDCGQAKVNQYPVLEVIRDIKVNGKSQQNTLSFLKTDKGFKLISFNLSTD